MSNSPCSTIDFVELTNKAMAGGSDDIYRELISLAERQVIQTVMKHTAGNLSLAARRLGITRNTLRSKLAYLGELSSPSSME